MRKRIFEIIEVSKDNDTISSIYDFTMLFFIVISIVPLMFKDAPPFFQITDTIATAVFIIDYLLRLSTADLKMKKGIKSFFLYPFTPWAIIDLVSILPSLTALNTGFKLFRLFRIFRTFRAFRVFRIFKAFRYSKNLLIIYTVISNSKDPLIAVSVFALGYIFVAALIIFNVEPESFSSFFDAIYWATVSLTTVGYGDIYPVSTIGRIITMLSSILGIAIVALPAGIITAGYLDTINQSKEV